MPITAAAIGVLAANRILDCLCRRSVGPFRAFRGTLRSEFGCSSKMYRPSVPSSSGTLGILFPLKNQQVGNNRDSPIRDERIASSRRQPQMNEPELGDSVPMVSSLLTAMPAASNEVWSHPSSCRGGTGSWTKVLTGSPLAPSSTYIPTRFRCHEGPRYWPNANNGGRNWHFGGKLHIGPPGHRGMSLFPPFRATRGSESGRLGWGNRAPATSSSGTLGFSSRSRTRGSATTATPRIVLRGPPPRERNHQ